MTRFFLYGLFGWCAEIVWTATMALVGAMRAGTRVNLRLRGHTYLWMLPIYGAGGLAFEIAHAQVAGWLWPLRGLLYMCGCFAVEYASGWVIKRLTGVIPWDYSYARWHVHGLIRLDYAPLWFGFGMLLEHVEVVVRAIEPVIRAVL